MTTGGAMSVAVVGGGIGGLCAAAALLRAGAEVTVYEQAEELREVGAGLTVWGNAVRALRRLGLADALVARGARIRRAAVLTPEGRVLAESRTEDLERLTGEPTVAVHRADLHGLLLAALPAGTVRLGARCAGFDRDDGGVTVWLEGGGARSFDLLVGADGINSVVRRQLFPEAKPVYAGYATWRGVAAAAAGVEEGDTSETFGRGSRFGVVPLGGGRVYWYATANTAAGLRPAPAESKELLLRRFGGWHRPVGRLVEGTHEGAILYNDICDLEPMRSWRAGRVVLLGDAAHATTPNMGQGACMAVESALTLARCLGEGRDVESALARYERERMPRTAWVTRRSRAAGRVGQFENRWACAARDLLLAAAPDALLRGTLERAVRFDC